jgi:preprotein translocase subunit SecE
MAIEAKAKAAPAPAKPRVSPGEFVRQVRAEIAKVTWPTRRETIMTTIMVLIMTTLLSVFFLGIDQVLGRFVKFLLSLAA